MDADYELAFQTVEGAKRALIVSSATCSRRRPRDRSEAVPVLARRHAVIVAAARDPELEPATTPPATARDVYGRRRARVLADRARVAHGLGRAGARWSRRRPNGLAAACVGAYLRAKAARPALSGRARPPGPVQHAEPDADQHRRQPEVAGHEALDQTRQHQPRHRPQHELHRRPRLPPQRLPARQRPGSTSAHPMRSPAVAATAMHDSSSTPWGRTSRSSSPLGRSRSSARRSRR